MGGLAPGCGVAPTERAVLWDWKSRLYRVLEAKDQDFSSMVFPCINVGREVESRFSTLNIRLQNCHCVYLPLVCHKYNAHCVVFSKATIPSLLFGSVPEKSWTEVHFNSCLK